MLFIIHLVQMEQVILLMIMTIGWLRLRQLTTGSLVGIPVIGENAEMVRRGALLSVSAEYYRMGFSGGRIASELLDGKKKPYEIGITKQIDPDWIVNMSVAKTLKKELPYDVWQKARKLYLYDGQAARP